MNSRELTQAQVAIPYEPLAGRTEHRFLILNHRNRVPEGPSPSTKQSRAKSKTKHQKAKAKAGRAFLAFIVPFFFLDWFLLILFACPFCAVLLVLCAF